MIVTITINTRNFSPKPAFQGRMAKPKIRHVEKINKILILWDGIVMTGRIFYCCRRRMNTELKQHVFINLQSRKYIHSHMWDSSIKRKFIVQHIPYILRIPEHKKTERRLPRRLSRI